MKSGSNLEVQWSSNFYDWWMTWCYTSPPNFVTIGYVLWEIWIIPWKVQNLPYKWKLLDWSRVTLIKRSSSWNHDYKWLRHLCLVLNWARSMTSYEYKSIWLRCIFGTHLVLKIDDQDQTFGWKSVLQVEKWAKCHWLHKCGLKSSACAIWLSYASFGLHF